MNHHTSTSLIVVLLALGIAAPTAASTNIYAADYEGLVAGALSVHPGSPLQDWWYGMMAGEATAQIHPNHGNPGQCLELYAPASNPSGSQTYGIRELGTFELWRTPRVTLSFDAFCSTDDEQADNRYIAQIALLDPTYLFGYATTAAFVAGESGVPRDVSGLDLVLMGFIPGVGNLPLPITVGQDLAWDVWHHVEIVLEPPTGRYVSLAVDGDSQDISDQHLPHFFQDGAWQPPAVIGILETQVVSEEWYGSETDDRVRLDNFSITAEFGEAPTIVSILDVGNDQGRQARLTWLRSRYDSAEGPAILAYDLYRRQDAAKLEGWDYVMTVPAAGDDVYQCVAPTLCDSTDAGICWSAFLLRAMTADPLTYFQSAPDSGYTADNLAPSTPASFAVAYGAGGATLTWSASTDPDFRFFRIYRSRTSKVEEVVQETVGTTWLDPAGTWHDVYRLAVVDVSGNESGAMSPSATTGAAGPPGRFALHPAVPNPFNPATTLAFDVPEGGGRVVLSIHDAAGRRVRTLADGPQEPGRRQVVWRGDDDHGRRVAAGLYFARLAAPDGESVVKMVLVE